MADLNELDDFKEIEKSGKLRDDLTLSNIYNVKIGGFGNPEIVRTFLASLTVDELEQDISVYETLSKDKNWPVSQIIQREVDKIRVSNISKDYVLRKERLVKYFPPIIVAILPRNLDDTFSLKLDFDKKEPAQIKEYIFEKSNYRKNDKLKPYFTEANDISLIQGLYLLQVSQVFDFTILCWDRAKYYAVVIDGQHRMDSLIESKKAYPAVKNYYQDVVFVEFSNLIRKENETVTPVEVVRRVFVDINTNAKKVGVVCQILMDDKELSYLIVQSLVDSVNTDGSAKPPERHLKSQLVDWYGESLKHNLPHLTGILSLQQIINDYLLDGSLSSIDDLRRPTKVKKWVHTLNSFFFVDEIIAKENSEYANVTRLVTSLKEYDRLCSLDEEVYAEDGEFRETTLFVYDYRTLEIAQKVFEELYASSIIDFFNEFEPYKKAYEVVNEAKGFEHGSTIYTALLSSRKKISANKVLKEALAELKGEMEDKLYGQYYHLYTVLGQKTLFNIMFKRIFDKFTTDFKEGDIRGITSVFLAEINSLVNFIPSNTGPIFGKKEEFVVTELERNLQDLGPIASQFWEGIIYENNRIIYNSQGIKSFSSAIEYMINLLKAIERGEKFPEFKISFMDVRIKRILKKSSNYSDEDLSSYAKQIIKKKEEFLISLFKKEKN